MSSIDERVVEMKFKDGDFKRGIKSALDALSSLKESLNFKGSGKGLEEVSAASKKFSLEGVSGALDSIMAKFNMMSVVGIAALATLTSKAVDFGLQMGKSVTGSMTEGFAEYELKLGSIQTIMAGTGEDLSRVNAKLDELNKYADDTIYSFADMTENIGKFTNAGVGLDESVAAIQGVANVAAISGANSGEASRAMYNFSQALSIGYVGLMDWKSIELANMGTSEFRQQLIDSAEAMGTLKKTGDDTWETLEGTEVTVKNFRNTLNDQWLTAEALTETLGRYSDTTTDIGERATAAAREVKTFSHLMDTLREGAGSGWANTFEILIGDFAEAKELWTGINEVVGGWVDRSAESRNAMLEGWKDLGGRDVLIEGLVNVFDSLMAVLKPIREAFRSIFPKSTFVDLYNLTVAFRDFTERLKMGEGATKAIRTIFTAFFLVIRTGINIVVGFLGYMWDLVGLLSGMSSGFFAIIGVFGKWISQLGKFVKNSDAISKFFDTLSAARDAVFAPFVEMANQLFHALAFLMEGDRWTALQTLKKALTPIQPAIDAIRNGLDSLLSVVGTTSAEVGGFLKGLGVAALQPFKNMLDDLTEGFTSLRDLVDFEFGFGGSGGKKAGEEIGAAAAAADLAKSSLSGLASMFKSLWGFLSPILSSIGNGIKTVFDAISGYISGLSFQEALALVNSGFFVMLYFQISQFMKGMRGLPEIFENGAESIEELTDTLKMFQTSLKAQVIMSIAIAVGVLAAAVWVLATIDSENLIKALTALSVMFVQLGVMLLAISKIDMANNSGMMSTAAGLVIMSLAILLLASAVKKLSDLDWEELAKGLIGTGVLLAALTLFTKFAEANKGAIAQAAGLILLSVAIHILVSAVEKLGEMDTGTLLKGMYSLTAIFTVLGVMVAVMNGTKGVFSAAAGLLVLAAALVALEFVIKRYANFDLATLATGLGKMAAVLIALGISMQFFPRDMPRIAAGLLIASAALLVLAGVLKIIGAMGLGELVKGVGSLVIMLGALAIALNMMNGTAAGSGALIVASAALVVMAVAIAIVAALPWEGVLLAIGSFIVLLAALVITGYAVAPVVPVLVTLGVAVGLLGLAMLAAGVGFAVFATGFATMAAVGVAGVAVLIAAFEGVIMLIPLFLEQIGVGLVALAVVIRDAGPVLVGAFATVLGSLLQAAIDLLPKVFELIDKLIGGMIDIVNRRGPEFVTMVVNLLSSIIQGLTVLLPDVYALITTLILGMISTVRTLAPEFYSLGSELVMGFIEELTELIPDVAEAGLDMIIELLDTVAEKVPDIVDSAADLVWNFMDGIQRNMPRLMRKARSMAKDFIREVRDMLIDLVPDIIEAGVDVGKAIGRGMKQGAEDMIPVLRTAGGGLGNAIATGAKLFLSVFSPSRLFREIGHNTGEGLVLGAEDKERDVFNAGAGLGREALEGVKSTISGIKSAMDGEIDINPTITPVLDLTQFNKKAVTMKDKMHIDPVEPLVSPVSNNKAHLLSSKYFRHITPIDPMAAGKVEHVQNNNYTQNNHSPKALSPAEVYRQTRNQLSGLKGAKL